MGQRKKRAERCSQCRLHIALCQCAQIPSLEVATRLVLVMHRREQHRPTATGKLALQVLPNHALLLHGYRDAPVDLNDHVEPGRRGLLLFPSDDAQPLTAAFLARDPRPVTLVVPDGSWRQASRAARRLPGVEHFENITLPEGESTRYQLRREPKEGGLATMEAIARAYGVLEGPQVQRALEDVFHEMVRRTLLTRQPPGPVR